MTTRPTIDSQTILGAFYTEMLGTFDANLHQNERKRLMQCCTGIRCYTDSAHARLAQIDPDTKEESNRIEIYLDLRSTYDETCEFENEAGDTCAVAQVRIQINWSAHGAQDAKIAHNTLRFWSDVAEQVAELANRLPKTAVMVVQTAESKKAFAVAQARKTLQHAAMKAAKGLRVGKSRSFTLASVDVPGEVVYSVNGRDYSVERQQSGIDCYKVTRLYV